jgi:hypothetical protein
LARGIRIVDAPVASIEVANDQLTGVRLGDGSLVAARPSPSPPTCGPGPASSAASA